MNRQVVMSWGKCEISIGKTSEDGSMAKELTLVEVIKDKSTSLSAEDGEALEAFGTGHELVGKEVQDGKFSVTTRVIEPEDSLLTTLGLGTAGLDGEFKIKTHIVDGDWSLKVDPKNVGGKGIKAPCCSVTYKPGHSEEEGDYADLTFDVKQGKAGYWYDRYTKQAPSPEVP